MKYLILALLLLAVSCKDDKSSQSNIGKNEKGSEVLRTSTKITPKFKCDDENKCIDSIVLIEDGSNFCQGVVKDGEVLVSKECAKEFICESLVITDTENSEYSCEEILVDNQLLKIKTKKDISGLNTEVAVLAKDDLTLKAYKLSKVGEQYQQEFALCSITLSSFKALASTKLNSLFLAIKDCDQLPIGSILFQDDKLVSISTHSDVLNLSQSLVCGDDCDSKEVDKLEFMIDEITAKTKLKKIRSLLEDKEFNGAVTFQRFRLQDNQIITTPNIRCSIPNNTSFLNTMVTENVFNRYLELVNSKLKNINQSFVHTQTFITLFLFGNKVASHSMKNKRTMIGVLSNTNLYLLENLRESLIADTSITIKDLEVPLCDTSNFIKL